jgi:hypothetical protein
MSQTDRFALWSRVNENVVIGGTDLEPVTEILWIPGVSPTIRETDRTTFLDSQRSVDRFVP